MSRNTSFPRDGWNAGALHLLFPDRYLNIGPDGDTRDGRRCDCVSNLLSEGTRDRRRSWAMARKKRETTMTAMRRSGTGRLSQTVRDSLFPHCGKLDCAERGIGALVRPFLRRISGYCRDREACGGASVKADTIISERNVIVSVALRLVLLRSFPELGLRSDRHHIGKMSGQRPRGAGHQFPPIP